MAKAAAKSPQAEQKTKHKMKIIETITKLEKIKKSCVLSIGNFDSVHIGHQQILTAARKQAGRRKTELAVMTFEPHPVTVLYPDKRLGVLTPLTLKTHLLKDAGVDIFIILKSSTALLGLSP